MQKNRRRIEKGKGENLEVQGAKDQKLNYKNLCLFIPYNL
jgi:hypothetical protein